jgi:TolB-like protein
MANRPTLLERLKQGRLFQALFVYLGATWFVLQLVGTLRDLLSLPDWIGPVTVILLAVGLLVVLATAWVQSLESTTAAEEAGERPTDWQVAPGDVLERLKSGKLPHLTWGRAVVGGLVAISLAIGAAGGYVLLTGGARLIGPTEAGADEAPAAIAVLPFQVSGADLEVYREGMVDLFSTNLDGFAGHRAVDSRTVMARWREAAGDALELDLDASLRVAGATDARYALVGNAVSAGTVVRLAADIYDLSDGTKVATGQVEGEATAILDLVDRLSVMLGGQLLGDPAAVGQVRLAAQTSSSVPALKAYLEGESLYRRSEWTASAEALERAVAEDSTLALAWSRLANTLGWITVGGHHAADSSRIRRRATPRGAPPGEGKAPDRGPAGCQRQPAAFHGRSRAGLLARPARRRGSMG